MRGVWEFTCFDWAMMNKCSWSFGYKIWSGPVWFGLVLGRRVDEWVTLYYVGNDGTIACPVYVLCR